MCSPSLGHPVSLQGSLDNINLFSIITIMSFFLLAPVTLLTEGVKFTPGAIEAMGVVNPSALMQKAVLAGFCFHAYQQVGAPCGSAIACAGQHTGCRGAPAALSQGRPSLLPATPAPLLHVISPANWCAVCCKRAESPLVCTLLQPSPLWSLCDTPHSVQVSYMILQRVSPVTHSIGNCLKRVIVIVASVIVFKNPMSQQNMIGELPSTRLLLPACTNIRICRSSKATCGCHLPPCPVSKILMLAAGTGIALAGVFSYSQVKRLTGKKKVATA